MVIVDVATYSMAALAVGFVDAHDADPAFDGKHPFQRLGTARRNLESAVDDFARGEFSLQAAVESIAAQVLGLGHQEIGMPRPMELNLPIHGRPVAPAAITLG